MVKDSQETKTNSDEAIVLHASSRVMVFCLILFLLSSAGVFFSLMQLRFEFGVERSLLVIVWRVVVAMGALWLGYIHLRHKTTYLTLNKDCVTKTSGIIAKNYSQVEISQITNYFARRSVLDLMLGLIDISIDTPGGDSKPEITFRFINLNDAKRFIERLRQLRSTNKESN